MPPTEQSVNARIAREVMGWEWSAQKSQWVHVGPGGLLMSHDDPDFENDLNACDLAEMRIEELGHRYRYIYALADICGCGAEIAHWCVCEAAAVATATPEQRCEALLKAVANCLPVAKRR